MEGKMSVKYFKPVTGAAVFVLALGLLFSPVMAVECGDINGNGQINVLDITALISYLYQGGPPPVDPAMADVNYSGSIDMLDITHLIGFLYQAHLYERFYVFSYRRRAQAEQLGQPVTDDTLVVQDEFQNVIHSAFLNL